MSAKHRSDLTRGVPLPSTWVNAIMEFVAGLMPNIAFTILDAVTIQVSASGGNGQVAVPIGHGAWRFNAAAVTATHPGGAAGRYDVYATAFENDLTAVDPADATNYGFGLAIRAQGSPPPATGATALSRVVAQVQWDGAKITSLIPLIGVTVPMPVAAAALTNPNGLAPVMDPTGTLFMQPIGSVPVGGIIPYAGFNEPNVLDEGGMWVFANGQLIDRTTYAKFYGLVGHAYNGNVDPGSNKVRVPDKRGRVSVGADDMGGTQGAAGRIPNSNRLLGQNGGEERHTLTATEMPKHGHPFWVRQHGPGDTAHAHNLTPSDSSGMAAAPSNQANGLAINTGVHTDSLGGGTGGSGPHNNLQPYEVDNWIVRVA